MRERHLISTSLDERTEVDPLFHVTKNTLIQPRDPVLSHILSSPPAKEGWPEGPGWFAHTPFSLAGDTSAGMLYKVCYAVQLIAVAVLVCHLYSDNKDFNLDFSIGMS